jgi:D-alanyl-D-alanine carboxypeptidase/D-alanyl-D-alanine-endopeptidase (penicillin-binding protein 4)
MKILSLILLIVFYGVNSIFAQNTIQTSIEHFANDASLKHASISFKVTDLATGTTVSEFNPNVTLPTASTAKLFSTATALDILGPDYRATTRIYRDGEIDSAGVLNGTLWIRGGGDPSLGSKYFNQEDHQLDFLDNWVKQLKELGITEIKGAVMADASAFGYNGVPDGWNWVDLGNYYGAGPSGLSIYDNLVRYRFSVPSSSGQLVRVKSIEPKVPGLQFHNYILSSTRKGDNAYLYGAPYSLDRFGSGTLPLGSSNFLVKGSLPDPEMQFAHELCEALKRVGIKVSDGAQSVRSLDLVAKAKSYDGRVLLIEHKGEKLIDIINYTNMRSVNLFAEHMINLVGYENTEDGSTRSGLTALENHWKNGFNIDGMQINDGSGLSRMNAISAQHFVGLLKQMNESKYASEFLSSLPVAGKSGTLKSVCQGQAAQNRMIAKSGSMTRIKSYAGYINGLSGKRYAFALIVNNYTCSSSALKRKMEVVFNKIALN